VDKISGLPHFEWNAYRAPVVVKALESKRKMVGDETNPEFSGDFVVDAPEVDARYMVPGLSRGLALLDLFTTRRTDMTLSEIAEGLNLSRSAAFRLVYTLEKESYLRRDPETRRFSLTSKVLSLGFVYLNTRPLTEIVYPCLQRLSALTKTAAHLSVLDGTHVVYMARVVPNATLVTNLQVGRRLPAHATASGRVLLSGIDAAALKALYEDMVREHRDQPPPSLNYLIARAEEDRARGYVMSESIFDPGVLSFAAPIRDGRAAIVAAINVVGSRSLMERAGDAAALNALVGKEAHDLSLAIGYSGPQLEDAEAGLRGSVTPARKKHR
jgi:IclR family pca regulon transcriptional regulator